MSGRAAARRSAARRRPTAAAARATTQAPPSSSAAPLLLPPPRAAGSARRRERLSRLAEGTTGVRGPPCGTGSGHSPRKHGICCSVFANSSSPSSSPCRISFCGWPHFSTGSALSDGMVRVRLTVRLKSAVSLGAAVAMRLVTTTGGGGAASPPPKRPKRPPPPSDDGWRPASEGSSLSSSGLPSSGGSARALAGARSPRSKKAPPR
mmetsp:Transcript_17049/g.50847  ORF Transcript_17049/g.50847 Transcript_17049/m.50847 type:complete len:207 (-) Transcript_17049:371-991(-)